MKACLGADHCLITVVEETTKKLFPVQCQFQLLESGVTTIDFDYEGCNLRCCFCFLYRHHPSRCRQPRPPLLASAAPVAAVDSEESSGSVLRGPQGLADRGVGGSAEPEEPAAVDVPESSAGESSRRRSKRHHPRNRVSNVPDSQPISAPQLVTREEEARGDVPPVAARAAPSVLDKGKGPAYPEPACGTPVATSTAQVPSVPPPATEGGEGGPAKEPGSEDTFMFGTLVSGETIHLGPPHLNRECKPDISGSFVSVTPPHSTDFGCCSTAGTTRRLSDHRTSLEVDNQNYSLLQINRHGPGDLLSGDPLPFVPLDDSSPFDFFEHNPRKRCRQNPTHSTFNLNLEADGGVGGSRPSLRSFRPAGPGTETFFEALPGPSRLDNHEESFNSLI